MFDVSAFLASSKYIFFDGAMGTMLQRHGLQPGGKTALMNMTAPDTVEMIHKMYIEAGSDIICANTFGANALFLEATEYSTWQVVTAAAGIAGRAARSQLTPAKTTAAVALDIGPTGQILEPAGDLGFDAAYEMFKEVAVTGEKAGADIAVIETMSDPEELRAAMLAVKENTSLPVFATMTFEKSGFTYMGCPPSRFIETAEKFGAEAVGINCSLEPQQMVDIVKEMARLTNLPLIVKPNAGLPNASSGYIEAEAFAAQMLDFAHIGVKVIGGCCGTTPEHIKALRKAFSDK